MKQFSSTNQKMDALFRHLTQLAPPDLLEGLESQLNGHKEGKVLIELDPIDINKEMATSKLRI